MKRDKILDYWIKRLRSVMPIEIVRRHRQTNDKCVEIISTSEFLVSLTGRLNTLPEAEECGYWVMLRLRGGKEAKAYYKGYPVYLLFLTPVHPKKRREAQRRAENIARNLAAMQEQRMIA